MPLFRKKPSEQELELIVLRAATLTRASEIDTGVHASGADIRRWVNFAIDERKLKSDGNSVSMATGSVLALLTEAEFLAEFMDYQTRHPGQPVPGEFRSKMLAVIEKSIQEFLSQR